MNCCDDTGRCTQGHGCPVRAARLTGAAGTLGEQPDPAADHDTDERLDAVLHALQIGLIAAAIALAALLLAGLQAGFVP